MTRPNTIVVRVSDGAAAWIDAQRDETARARWVADHLESLAAGSRRPMDPPTPDEMLEIIARPPGDAVPLPSNPIPMDDRPADEMVYLGGGVIEVVAVQPEASDPDDPPEGVSAFVTVPARPPCSHPRASERRLGYATLCGECGERVR